MIIGIETFWEGILFFKEIRRKRNDLVCEQYINVCKWDGQDF
jgi:hypothetical protein